jgi:serine protease
MVATLAACSGGGSLPVTSSTNQMPQSIPRRVVDSSGATRTILYTVEVERSGRVGSGTSNSRTTLASGSGNLIYHNGPIQPAPKVYVVYWGSTWTTTGDPRGVKTYLNNFLTRVGGSSWLSSVTQYTQTGGTHVGNASGSFGGSWNDTSTIPSLGSSSSYQSYLAAEARKAATHFGNTSVSASYVIALPHSVRVFGFAPYCNFFCIFFQGGGYCAWHSATTSGTSTIAYTNLPYEPDAGSSCGQGSVNSPGYDDGVSIVEGHEQAETETDPQLNAWYDSSGEENGDKCAWTNLQNTSFGGTTLGTNEFPTQPLWSNSAGGCVQ